MIKRDATALGSRESEQAFFSSSVETVSTFRETVLLATCKAYKINNGDICGAGLHGDTNENIQHSALRQTFGAERVGCGGRCFFRLG